LQQQNLFAITAEGAIYRTGAIELTKQKQDAQLPQTDRAAGCVIVFAKSVRLELGDNILRTL